MIICSNLFYNLKNNESQKMFFIKKNTEFCNLYYNFEKREKKL